MDKEIEMQKLENRATSFTFTVGDRTYDLVVFHREGEDFVSGDTMVARAEELEAASGEEDGHYILEHQNEIPASIRGKVAMVLPNWRDEECARYLHWNGHQWCQTRYSLGARWGSYCRLVR